jgi:mevalonate kinase
MINQERARPEMSQMKKKSFSFEEEELAWINPLLVEWTKENKGKSQSDLMLQLLRDFRVRKHSLRESLDGATSTVKEKVSVFSIRSKDSLDTLMSKSKEGLSTLHDMMESGSGKLIDQMRSVKTDALAKLDEIKSERTRSKEDEQE